MGFEVETASPCATRLLVAGKRDVESDASTKVQPYRGADANPLLFCVLVAHKGRVRRLHGYR